MIQPLSCQLMKSFWFLPEIRTEPRTFCWTLIHLRSGTGGLITSANTAFTGHINHLTQPTSLSNKGAEPSPLTFALPF